VIAFVVTMVRELTHRAPERPRLAGNDDRSKHDSLMVRTKRSAWASAADLLACATISGEA
jgi:hypothetical protein